MSIEFGVEPRRREDRIGDLADHGLDLGVADHRRAPRPAKRRPTAMAAASRRSRPVKIPSLRRIYRVHSLTTMQCDRNKRPVRSPRPRPPPRGKPSMSDRQPFRPSRRSAIDPFIVMEMMAAANARAATGADVLHLEVGEPCGGAPAGAIAAATAALARSSCGYTEAFGLPALRHRLGQPLPGDLWRGGRSGPDRDDGGRLGRLHPGLSRRLRGRRPGRRHRARLPGLSQYPALAGHRGRGGADRHRDPVPADAGAARPGRRVRSTG